MSVIRAFIAVHLSDEIISGLGGVLGELKKRLMGSPVRWSSPKNIHLTLKFLGDVSVTNLDMLTGILQSEAARHAPFSLEVSGLGAFPSTRRPRVIWMGVQAPPDLSALQRGVEAEMARLGYAPEGRAFSPHLTLGRVSRTAGPAELHALSAVLDRYKVGSLGVMQVEDVRLFRSDLNPGGAVYTQLFSAPLSHSNP